MQLHLIPGRALRAGRRLKRDRSGVAMIEFAFSLPILIALGMTGVETANFVIAVLRVNQLAMMAADNAGRVRNSIDETDVNEVMAGIKFAGNSIAFGANGRLILSSVQSNEKPAPNTGYKIVWQRCFGAKTATWSYGNEGTGATTNVMANGIGTGTNRITPVTNSSLIYADVRYTYHPIVAPQFALGDIELKAVQAFTVRERPKDSEGLTNGSSLSTANKRLCDGAHRTAT